MLCQKAVVLLLLILNHPVVRDMNGVDLVWDAPCCVGSIRWCVHVDRCYIVTMCMISRSRPLPSSDDVLLMTTVTMILMVTPMMMLMMMLMMILMMILMII